MTGARVSILLLALAAATAAGAKPQPQPRLVPVAEYVPDVPAAVGAAVDTVYLLGGPGALDGRFEDALGDPDPQGWTSVDLTQATSTHWQVSTFEADVLVPSVPGNHAWWCGDFFEPCFPDDPPEGFGNYWDDRLVWTAAVPAPQQGVTVRVRARVGYGIEPGEDWFSLDAWRGDHWEVLRQWTGTAAVVAVDESVALDPADYGGAAGDEVMLRWHLTTDGGWSDEDCQWPGTGARVDSVAVTFDQGGGEALVGTVETCEPGDPLQWVPTPRGGVGDFAALRAGLDDLDPDSDNASPQFAFVDDGVVVPGTGGTPCVTWCYGPDGWIVNQDGGVADYYARVWNHVRSPLLPVPAGAGDGALLAFDVYVHALLDGSMAFVVGEWYVRSTADPAGLTGWTDWRNRNTVVWGGPAYVRVQQEVSDLLTPGAAWVQVSLGARDLELAYGHDGTPAPYFDNVSLKVYPLNGPNVLLVRPDGTGDAPTIQAALDIAAVGDTIRLADGTYTGPGNRDLVFQGKDVVVCAAAADPALCVVDCGGSEAEPHRFGYLESGEGTGAQVRGLTIRGGWQSTYGGALRLKSTSPVFADCVFIGNTVGSSTQTGGAVAASGGAPRFERCVFTGNRAGFGGAVSVRGSATPTFTDCLFYANYADQGGAALGVSNLGTVVTVTGCTFADHTSYGSSGVIALYGSPVLTMDHSIVAFSVNGPAIYFDVNGTPDATLSCCDLYGTPAGTWIGPLAAQLGADGNITADPWFCGDGFGDDPYGLLDVSPCAPAAPGGCGLMGARPVACIHISPVPVDVPGAAPPALAVRPNPFNPVTVLSWTMARGGPVEVTIVDLRQRRVRTLLAADLPAGPHQVAWRGDDDAGRPMASGVYLAVLSTDDGRATTKLALIR